MHDPLPSAWFFRLKAAQRDLIKRCGGPKRACVIASLSDTQMSRLGLDHHPDLMTLPVVAMLQEDCGQDYVTEALAELRGKTVSERHDAKPLNADVQMRHAEAIVMAGQLVSAGALAFADGKLTPAEAASIDKAAAALDAALGELRLALAMARAG